MKFTKMHGAGNDYIYVDCTQSVIDNPSQVAIDLSDRHFGIGSDGLILIKKSDKADFFMEMYNADGSQGQMCGNGIRCVGKFVYDNGLTDKTTVTIDTLAGVKILELKTGADGKVETARVNMGAPILEAAQIPVDTKELKEYKGCEIETIAGQVVKTPVVDETIVVEGKEYKVTAASMGNPHAIVYLDKDTLIPLSKKIFEAANEEYNRSSDFFNREIRDVEYEVILDLAFEALEYDDIVLVNAPFTKEIRDLNYVKQLSNSLKEKGAELTFVWVDATPETCHQRMIERNSTRDTWKLTHWDEYIKGVDFSIPTPLASSGCKLIIFDNNLSSDFDKVLANTVKLIEE